jgi:hypothetical protein
MRHLKTYEKRNFKDYIKYSDNKLLEEFLKDNNYRLSIEYVKIYEENKQINLALKTWHGVYEKFFKIMKQYLGDIDYYIAPNNGNQITIEFFNIDKNFLNILEEKIESNKYNL